MKCLIDTKLDLVNTRKLKIQTQSNLIGFDSTLDSKKQKGGVLIVLYESVKWKTLRYKREENEFVFTFLRFQLRSIEHAQPKNYIGFRLNLNITLNQVDSGITFAMHVSMSKHIINILKENTLKTIM